jgi:phasin family protein
MYITPEQIRSANKVTIEAALSIAATQFAALEKLANLNTSAVKSAVDNSVSGAKALLDARNPEEFVALQKTLAKPTLEKAAAYSKGVCALADETGGELTRIAERNASELNQALSAMADQVSKTIPPGFDFGFSAMKWFFSTAASTYETTERATKRALYTASENVEEAAKTVSRAAHKGANA